PNTVAAASPRRREPLARSGTSGGARGAGGSFRSCCPRRSPCDDGSTARGMAPAREPPPAREPGERRVSHDASSRELLDGLRPPRARVGGGRALDRGGFGLLRRRRLRGAETAAL